VFEKAFTAEENGVYDHAQVVCETDVFSGAKDGSHGTGLSHGSD